MCDMTHSYGWHDLFVCMTGGRGGSARAAISTAAHGTAAAAHSEATTPAHTEQFARSPAQRVLSANAAT